MSDELKPCPACNSKRNLYYGESRNPREQVVGCSFCEVEIHENNWNTRPIEDDLRAKLALAIEALEKATHCQEHRAPTCAANAAEEALAKIRS